MTSTSASREKSYSSTAATQKEQVFSSTAKYVFPATVKILCKGDFKIFNEKLMEIGQALGMTEELVFSISTKNPELQKTYDMRFKGVANEQKAPLTGYMTADSATPAAGASSTGRFQGDRSVVNSESESKTTPGQSTTTRRESSAPPSRGGGRGADRGGLQTPQERGRRRWGLEQEAVFPRARQDVRAGSLPEDEYENEYERNPVQDDIGFSTPLQPRAFGRSFSSPESQGFPQLPPLPQELKDYLGVSRNDEKLILTSEMQFINMHTWTKEPLSKRKARSEIWIWMRGCLFLDITKNVRGIFASALEGVHLNDICLLLTKIKKLCTRPNIVTIARSVADFFTSIKRTDAGASPAQFYIGAQENADTINQSLEALERARGNTKLTGGFRLTPFVAACMTLNSISTEKKFEHLMFNLAENEDDMANVMESPAKFIQCIDDYQQNLATIRGEDTTLTAFAAVDIKPSGLRPQDACWRNYKGVFCRLDCRFKHYKQEVTPPAPGPLGMSNSSNSRGLKCYRCGVSRILCPDSSKCSALRTTCTNCKKVGHVATICKARKAGISVLRANLAYEGQNDEEPEEQRGHYTDFDFGDDTQLLLLEEDREPEDESCNMCTIDVAGQSSKSTLTLKGRGTIYDDVTNFGEEFFEDEWGVDSSGLSNMCDLEINEKESGLITFHKFEECAKTGFTAKVHCENLGHPDKQILACNAAHEGPTKYTRYISDTGSNVTITNSKVPLEQLYFAPSSIALAGSDSKIVSSAKCTLTHRLRGGHALEITKVVNNENARNLISVPNLVKAGLSFIYDENEMRVYLTKGLKVEGHLVDREDKCPDTGLYPWTMEDCSMEEQPNGLMICANAIVEDVTPRSSVERLKILRSAFSGFLSPSLTAKFMANLARAYPDHSQDENSRNHDNLCHMGSKLINAVFPKANYPAGGCACQECVDSKAHRIPKPKRLDDKKNRNLKPGERSQADFQGPFAGACGGKKFSLEFIDVPSGYGDTYACKATTDFYQVFPIHWRESWAVSGNRMRFFESDNDPVFLSKESSKIFQETIVSHSTAAPYEHCPHIEAQNRIRFESVAAMLKKANGKSVRWPQARRHLLFTLNNMRVVKMDDGTFISKRNIFENNTSVFDPVYFIAFGTGCKVQIPAAQREGGKGPGQSKTYDGAVVGYMKSGLGYQVEHSENKKTYQVGFTMITVFPGKYPWKEDSEEGPKVFYPTFEAALDEKEWSKFNFNETEATKALDAIQDNLIPIVSTYLSNEKKTDDVIAQLHPALPSKLFSPSEEETKEENVKSKEPETQPASKIDVISVEHQLPPVEKASSSKSDHPGELVCSKLRKPKRNQRIYVLEREGEDGSGRWYVVEADVLPRVNSPNATKMGHERCVNVKDPLDIWDVPRDNIDFNLEAAQVRCDQSNDPSFTGIALVPQLEEVFESTIQSVRLKSAELQAFSALSKPLLFSDKPVTMPSPREWEVKSHPFAKFYLEAGDKEFEAVELNKTWILVDIAAVPPGHKIIPTKMIFSDKVVENVCVRAKGRLVAQGNHQGTNSFGETYAGVMDVNGFRIQLAELIQSDTMQGEHWDSSNAYLNGVLEEEVYGSIPPRYRDRYPGKCWRFLKAIYGLRQAGNVWKKLTNSIMAKAGGKANAKDPCVFEIVAASFWVRVFTVVDDFFVFFEEASRALRNQLWKICTENIREINNLGELSWVLKCTIQIDRPRGLLKFSQGGFVREVLARFKLEEIQHAATPAFEVGDDAKMLPEDLEMRDEDKEALSKLPIREIIGCCWWLVKMTRADICLATQQVSRYQSKPSFKLWRQLMRIIAYLAGSQDVGLIYLRNRGANMREAFSDASLGDLPGSKSTLGLIYFVWRCLVHWASTSSSRVYLSSCEAEANALIKLQKFDQWLVLFMFYQCNTLHPGLPTYVGEDNTSTIALTSGNGSIRKSKHYTMEWDALVEAISLKELVLVYTKTDDQLADMWTKPLGRIKITKFRAATMGTDEDQKHFEQKKKIRDSSLMGGC